MTSTMGTKGEQGQMMKEHNGSYQTLKIGARMQIHHSLHFSLSSLLADGCKSPSISLKTTNCHTLHLEINTTVKLIRW